MQFFIALDIGGTLIKAGFPLEGFSSDIVQKQNHNAHKLFLQHNNEDKKTQDKFLLKIFNSLSQLFQFIRLYVLQRFQKILVHATGGGSLKFKPQFKKFTQQYPQVSYQTALNQFQVCGEALKLFALPKQYSHMVMIENHQKEIYSIVASKNKKQDSKVNYYQQKQHYFPLILVNIGSGISFLQFSQVEGKKQNLEKKLERVGGTSLGGGFLMGMENLVNLDFDFQNFQSLKKESIQMQVMKAYCEHIAQLCLCISHKSNTFNLFFSGSLTKSLEIRQMISDYIHKKSSKQIENEKKIRIYFSQVGGFLGVIGLLFKNWKKQ